jgi:hypothetical protein
MTNATPDPTSGAPPRRSTVVAAGLLLVALALVVIYTSRGAFRSPLALVVVAAIGLAALLLQLRLRPGLASSIRSPLWLNGIGVGLAMGAVFADFLHLTAALTQIAALAAVVSFALSGIIVLNAMRKRRV